MLSVSVVIPTYNSALTIEATIHSVLKQSLKSIEILILDDGSTDDTVNILNKYRSNVTVFQQRNQGVASARNTLCQKAQGELIAFLDHDDLWHPRYLEVQQNIFNAYPNAVALFTGHKNIYGYGQYDWNQVCIYPYENVELINPINFIKQYTFMSRQFASMSFCCIPKNVLRSIGSEPFCKKVSGADDFFLFHLLPLFGPIVYAPTPLVAYRITKDAQSEDRLKSVGLGVNALESLSRYYEGESKIDLNRVFKQAFAVKRRDYAKVLMGVGKVDEARQQLWKSLYIYCNVNSIVKSMALLLLTLAPSLFPQKWVSRTRS